MIRRLALAAVLALTVGAVAFAQDFAIVQQTADTAVLIDRQTVRRAGNAASVRTYAYARPGPGAPQVYVEVEEEYDCAQLRARRRILRILDPQGRTVSQEQGVFGQWQALTPANVQVMVAVCQGQGMAAFPSAGTLAAFSQRMAPGQARPSLQAQAPAPPSPAPIEAPAPLAVWIENNERAAGANPTLVQAGTRRINGLVASVVRLTLLAEPVVIGGQPMHWRETTTEFQCFEHRARTADRTYYDLGRTRRAPAQDTAFSQWFDAPAGSILRAQEDLACRGVRGPNARDITDLDAYQRQFFAGRSAPSSLAVAAPTSRWVTMADGSVVNGVSFFDMTSRRRVGDVVFITELQLAERSNPRSHYWLEVAAEYDCAVHRKRTTMAATYPLDRSQRTAARDATPLPWLNVPANTTTGLNEAFVCRDVASAQHRVVANLDEAGRVYMASRSQPTPTAPARAEAAPPRTLASGSQWVHNTNVNNNSTERLFDLGSRRRTGSVVSVSVMRILLKAPSSANSLLRWFEETTEFDCDGHRSRSRLDAYWTIDLKERLAVERPTWDAWSVSEPIGVARENEDLICRNQASTHRRVADLQSFQRAYYAEKGEQQPESLDDIFASARAALRWRAYTDPAASVAAIWDSSSEQTQGSLVNFTELILARQPVRSGAVEYYWKESASQMDCANHRVRYRYTALLDRGRRNRVPVTNAPYEPWRPTPSDRYLDRLWNNLCNNRPSDTFRVIDLDAFERSFLGAAGP